MVEELSSGDEEPEATDDENDDSLASRVRTAITYTRTQLRKDDVPLQTTRFEISLLDPHRTAVDLLRASTPHKSPP